LNPDGRTVAGCQRHIKIPPARVINALRQQNKCPRHVHVLDVIVNSLRSPDASRADAEIIVERVFSQRVIQNHVVFASLANVIGECLRRDASARERIEGGVQARLRELERTFRAVVAQVIVVA
jgi:hypothetical protein